MHDEQSIPMKSHSPCVIFHQHAILHQNHYHKPKVFEKKQDQHPLFFASLVRSKHYYHDCECQWRARNTIILLIPCGAHSIIHFLGKLHQQGYFDYGMVQLYRTLWQRVFKQNPVIRHMYGGAFNIKNGTTLWRNFFHLQHPELLHLHPQICQAFIPVASSSTDIVNVAEGF